MALDFEGGHLGIADGEAFRVEIAVEIAGEVRPVSVFVALINWMMTWWLTSGLPRQFCEIKAKRRCSMRFHLLVPGGRWVTCTDRPVSSAKRCSSSFQRRTLAPLLPPQSAVRV